MSLEDTLYPLLKLYERAPQPLKSLAGRAYRAVPRSWRLGGEYARFRAEALDSPSWSPAGICDYQTRMTRDSLLAAAQAPFYAERFRAAGVDPARFEALEQLSDYPMLEKTDLIRERERMVNPALPASARLLVTTGGSSGQPVGFYLHKGISRPKEQAYLEAQWARTGYRPGDRVAVIRGAVTARGGEDVIHYYDAARDWLVLSSYHLTAERLPEYARLLNEFQPRHLHAYPSAALLLARGMEQSGLRLDFALKSVLCGSEKLSAEDQAYLTQAFAAPVCHWYGHSERVVLAGQGTAGDHLYFWPAYGHAELGAPDELGFREVIGTSFHNHVMPLIRYRTGDYVKLAARPDRELPWLEIEGVMGRSHEFLIGATGRRVSLTAMNMHDAVFDGLLAVQFVQSAPGRVELRLQPGPRWSRAGLAGIEAAVTRKLGPDFELRLTEVAEVEKTAGGKHRWLISGLTGQAADAAAAAHASPRAALA